MTTLTSLMRQPTRSHAGREASGTEILCRPALRPVATPISHKTQAPSPACRFHDMRHLTACFAVVLARHSCLNTFSSGLCPAVMTRRPAVPCVRSRRTSCSLCAANHWGYTRYMGCSAFAYRQLQVVFEAGGRQEAQPPQERQSGPGGQARVHQAPPLQAAQRRLRRQ